MTDLRRVLVVGSTGYIGTRLVSALLRKGFRVNAGYRDSTKIKMKSWSSHPNLTPVKADVFDVESLISATQGCFAAFYLVHSMYGKGDFVNLDRTAAENMVKAAEQAELKRIIYLSGLGEVESGLSKHLASRMEVSRILHDCSVPATTLRAAMIIGAGSASFEIMRYLVDRLPAMVTPRWVRTKSQP
ncbi:MAG: NAD(P)H-binding protein, partial [Candidatus Thorarchaeota archaeon]